MRPSLVLKPCLLAAMLLAAMPLARPAAAAAALRSPQVPVLGGTLQGYLDGVGEHISVNTDQQAMQRWISTVSNNSTFTIQIELAGKSPDATVFLYSASAATPTPYLLFPTPATNGWFVVASFRSAPTRVVVSLFDNNATFQGSNSYLGADRSNFAFGMTGPGGTFYTEDARNPGGQAQFLVYDGTGLNTGAWWICGEDTPVAGRGSDQDYDDVILFAESLVVCICTPTIKTTWGELKASYR